MKIIRKWSESRLDRFAERHDLTLLVMRRSIGTPHHFYCHFENCEVMQSGMLVGAYGNGHTEAEAISDYATKISGARIAIDAMRPSRREIDVPFLVPSPPANTQGGDR